MNKKKNEDDDYKFHTILNNRCSYIYMMNSTESP